MNKLIDEFVRDVTKVVPMSKSEARRRINDIIKEAIKMFKEKL